MCSKEDSLEGNGAIGPSLDSFLEEEGVLQEAIEFATKKILALQIKAAETGHDQTELDSSERKNESLRYNS